MPFAYTRRFAAAAMLALAFAVPSAAQGTTGVAGVNDYTMNGMTPGSSSCTFLFPFPSGPAVCNVSTAPGAPVVFLFNLNCPCTPCFLPWLPTGGCGLPPLVCGPSDHAFELNATFPGCVLLSAPASADSTGNATLTVVFPPMVRIASQAVMLNPCAVGAPPLVFSQAYQVSTV